MYVQAAAATRIREYFATSPLAEHVTEEMQPGFETVPQDTDWRNEAWEAFIKKTLNGNSHPDKELEGCGCECFPDTDLGTFERECVCDCGENCRRNHEDEEDRI
jgi:hypothetical protein